MASTTIAQLHTQPDDDGCKPTSIFSLGDTCARRQPEQQYKAQQVAGQ